VVRARVAAASPAEKAKTQGHKEKQCDESHRGSRSTVGEDAPELGKALPAIAPRIVVVSVPLAVAGAEGLEVLRGGAAGEGRLLLVGGGVVATLAAHMVGSLGVVVVPVWSVWFLGEGARGGGRRVGAGGHGQI
jgi:hypothetical protein